MQKIITIFIFLMSFSTVNAQLFDSIKTSFDYKPKLLVKMDARNSFVTASYAKVKGVKVGLSYHKIFKFGVGYSWMKTDFYPERFLDSTNLRFAYVNTFLEYTFFQTEHWQFEIPVQMGLGRISYKDTDGELLQKQWVPIWEPAMTFEYLFLKYFGVGVGAGYRLVIKPKTPIAEQFTSPIYILKFKVYFGDIYKDVKKFF
jgi:hypothetical protein